MCADIPFKSCMNPEKAKTTGINVELDKLYTENSSQNKFPPGAVAKVSFEGVLKVGQIGADALVRVTIKAGGLTYFDYDYKLCSIVTGGSLCPMKAPTKKGKTIRSKFTITEQLPYYLPQGEYSMSGSLLVGGQEVACPNSCRIIPNSQ